MMKAAMLQLIVYLVICQAGPEQPVPMWTAERIHAKTLPRSEGKRLSAAELSALQHGQPLPPYPTLTVGVQLPGGVLCVGGPRGVMLQDAREGRWRVFNSRRWLPDDVVQDIAVTADGAVYVQTPAGLGRLRQEKKTLEQKMTEIHAELRRRHLREGLVGRIVLKVPGQLDAGWSQPDNDNDGLWTSLYVAAEAFRYGATRDPQAKKNAWESLQALMFLEKVTGISGFVARSIVATAQPKPDHGEWHKSADGKWWWKGDTSSDEVAGHYFAYAVYCDLAATAEEKSQIRAVVRRVTDHILDHGYYYVGPSGKPTTWGVWAPEKLNHDLKRIGDRGLNSLEILSHLKVAEHITGNPRYANAARELIEKHAYAINTVHQKMVWPESVNHSDDELAFLAYYPLLTYERDPKLRAIYLTSLERSWKVERAERSPFFNLIYAACRQASALTDPSKRPDQAGLNPGSYDQKECLDWFRDVPQDLIDWTVRNSDRQDLGELATNRFKRKTSRFVLNVAERRQMRWNGDPYELDGGADGRVRDDGTFVLLPYWLGRYHRLLE
jgi:hypothetical protein